MRPFRKIGRDRCGEIPGRVKEDAFLPRLILGFVLVNALMVAIAVVSLSESHRHALEQATLLASDLVQLEEKSISNVIERVDLSLLNIVEEIENKSGETGGDTSMNAIFDRQMRYHRELDSVRFADETGRIAYGVGVSPSETASVADREYFITARENPDCGLIISKPMVGRLSGKWVVILARRVNRPGGDFAGVAYATITLEKFQDILRSFRLGPEGIMTLLNVDMEIVVRQPEPNGPGSAVNQRITASIPFMKARDQGPKAGVYRSTSPVDSIKRVMAYRKLSRYPGYIFVGLADDDYLAAWRKERAAILILMALVVLATGTASWRHYVGHMRQEALNRHLNQLAHTDPLTGCANRRYFLELLELERLRTQRREKPFCVLALDLDHFKSVNDRHGHSTGDLVLTQFVAGVARCLRVTDILGRMGGEEFAVLLPEVSLDAAVMIAERIRAETQASRLSEPSGSLGVTVSIGVAQWRRDGQDSLESLMDRADAALYAAKGAGRNVVRADQMVASSDVWAL